MDVGKHRPRKRLRVALVVLVKMLGRKSLSVIVSINARVQHPARPG